MKGCAPWCLVSQVPLSLSLSVSPLFPTHWLTPVIQPSGAPTHTLSSRGQGWKGRMWLAAERIASHFAHERPAVWWCWTLVGDRSEVSHQWLSRPAASQVSNTGSWRRPTGSYVAAVTGHWLSNVFIFYLHLDWMENIALYGAVHCTLCISRGLYTVDELGNKSLLSLWWMYWMLKWCVRVLFKWEGPQWAVQCSRGGDGWSVLVRLWIWRKHVAALLSTEKEAKLTPTSSLKIHLEPSRTRPSKNHRTTTKSSWNHHCELNIRTFYNPKKQPEPPQKNPPDGCNQSTPEPLLRTY